ncbi:hypothetical protein MNBD_GAMMA10-3342 [hydrothermal vent metagenome]|uniref:Uncharacterized protein n=1 Tax=hydrothermal vent metagenome TaxID=652676 RepID=A0A3B0X5B4_9ZZZZ
MLNRVSRYNKYSALLIKVILFSSLSCQDKDTLVEVSQADIV